MRNRGPLKHYLQPGDLQRQFGVFALNYRNQHQRDSLGILTPADVDRRRAEQILKQREELKRKTMFGQRLRHQTQNAQTQPRMGQRLQHKNRSCTPNYLTTDTLPPPTTF